MGATVHHPGVAPVRGQAKGQGGHAADVSSGRSGVPDDEKQQRKQQVLTKGRASIVGSIADAIVAKNGEPYFLCQPDGQIPIGRQHGYGFYHHDTRFLGGYELTLGGKPLNTLASAGPGSGDIVLELTNPSLPECTPPVAEEQLGITWRRSVERDGPALRDELELRNFGADPVELPCRVRFEAGFEDVFVIRGLLHGVPGTVHDPAWRDRDLVFGYSGSDGVDREARVSFDPPPADRNSDGAVFGVKIGPRQCARLRVRVELVERVREGAQPIEGRSSPEERPRSRSDEKGSTTQRPHEGDWIGEGTWPTTLRTSSLALRSGMIRSLDDLAELRGRLDGLRYYEAGIPWFATLFGRDSLISAYQTLAFDPAIAADTLRLFASKQGTTDDAWRDEQPGKILHELRIGELARTRQIPHTPYYGTVDATPLFLILLGRQAAWTGSLDLFNELHGAVDAALGWIDRAVHDGGGFVAYWSDTDHGLVNQGWKDSGDGIVNASGAIAQPPIALVEVQGYAFRAWREIAALFEQSGDASRADSLRRRAEDMRQRFEDAFWSNDLGTYVLALASGEPCEVVTSNAGQVTWTGISGPERARRVADRLLRPDMFNGWGVRTLSSDATAYRPIGYHLGTVWPHDNSLIAAGFRQYGLDEPAERIFLSILEAAQDFPHARLPECFAGFERDRFGVPVRYPVACHPQAWAAGSIPELLRSNLGLEPDGFSHRLRVLRPRLPEGVRTVEIRDLAVGGGRAHLRFTRGDGTARVEVLGVSGDLDVVVGDAEPVPVGPGEPVAS